MRLLTVIVNYNSGELTLRALDAVVPQLAALGEAPVWVVDNASPDDSLEILQQGFAARGFSTEQVRLIESPVNGGFGAGNNVALREALALEEPPEFIYLLNPDAEPDAGAVEAGLAFLESHSDAGIIGCCICNPDRTPRSSSFRFPSILSELISGVQLNIVTRALKNHTVYMEPPAESRPVDWVTGASMMLRCSALERIGLFDEEFFLYFEETDLCHRAHDAGWAVYYVKESIVFHERSAITGFNDTQKRRQPYWFDSRRHYLRKHHGWLYLWTANGVWASGFLCQRIRHRIQRKKPLEFPHLLRDFLWYNLFPEPASGR